MQILRKLGWRVNVEDIDGRTALHLASSSNNLEAVKYLAANGADIMKQDLRGDDPIQDAIRM
jgi:ankyrin repeat protein